MINGITDLAPLIADEAKAGAFIEKLRWPEGVRCAHCDHEKVYELKGPNPKRKQWNTRKMPDGERMVDTIKMASGIRQTSQVPQW